MPEESINLSTLIKKYVTTEHITVATLLLYGWGFLYNYFYYQYFGVNIISYLSLPEILIDAITSISCIVLMLLITQILVNILAYLVFILLKKIDYWMLYPKLDGFYKKQFLTVSILIDMILIQMFVLFIHNDSTILKIDSYVYFKYFFPALLFSVFVKSISMDSLILFGISTKKFLIIFFPIMLLTFIYGGAKRTYEYKIKTKSDYISTFEMSNGKSYSTNDSIFNIGETNSTIFLFDNNLKKTIIINRNNLIQATLTNKTAIKKVLQTNAAPKKK